MARILFISFISSLTLFTALLGNDAPIEDIALRGYYEFVCEEFFLDTEQFDDISIEFTKAHKVESHPVLCDHFVDPDNASLHLKLWMRIRQDIAGKPSYFIKRFDDPLIEA